MGRDDSKRYYWLKLDKDFFKRHDIRIVESMDNGKDYVLFYLKLICESTTHQGKLRFSEIIPYNEKMLAVLTNTNIDVVRSAMQVFTELGMIEVLDDQTIYMKQVEKMIGSETHQTRRKRENAENSMLEEGLGKNYPKLTTEIEIEKELEIEKDTDIEKKRKRFTPPTVEEVKAYCIERGNSVDAERFIDYYTSNGWKVGKNSMKDWKAAVRTWEKRDKPKEKSRNEVLEMLERGVFDE